LPETAPVDPFAPGPFAFADPDRVKLILTEAGFRNVRVEPLDTVMNLGNSLDSATQQMLEVGPLSRAVAEANETARAKIAAAVRVALEKYATADGITPAAACWLVGAKA